jgi:hypothetical protein
MYLEFVIPGLEATLLLEHRLLDVLEFFHDDCDLLVDNFLKNFLAELHF